MTKALLPVVAGALALIGSAALAAPPLPPGTPDFASLKGNPVAGKAVFAQCGVCHSIVPNKNGIGPSLYGVVDRPSASVPGFTYSAANKNSHIVWTEPVLYAYLIAPQQYVPGTKMIFAGLKDAQKRADVIAYLKSKPTS
ncbi:MAG: c-type cytochrome [Janthinobacterium lividum]